MQNKILPRREARENAFLLAFSNTFAIGTLDELLAESRLQDTEHPVDAYGELLLRAAEDHSAEIDDLIQERLRGWTLRRLPRVTVTALRLALAEMLYGPEKKPGVAINEMVELVKKYGADDDYQFVNGLLGSVARDLNLAVSSAEESEN